MADQAPTDSPILSGVDPLIGQEVGGTYRIVRIMGSGGMGTVYEARHLRLNRRCAVKVLLHALQDDATYIERFRREAEVTSRLRNRHICEVLDFNHLPDGSPYLAMEYLEGEDLATRLRRGPLSAAEMAPVVDGVGQALSAAHAAGVLHRDIKPANVFLARTSEGAQIAKLLDFGAAKRQGHDRDLTALGQVLGSVWYVSPEQARGLELDARTDIFSLGIVLYEGLTGRNPFEAASPTDTLFKIVSDMPPSVRTLVPALPPAIDAVLARALAKRREDRYPTAREFAAAAVAALAPRPAARKPWASGEIPLPAPAARATAEAALRSLAERGLLTPAQAAQAQPFAETEGELFFDRLVSVGLIDERTLLRFVAGSSGLKYITADTLAKSRAPVTAVAMVPGTLAEGLCIVPLALSPIDGQLTIAVAEPNPDLLEAIRQQTGARSVQAILALRGTIRAAIARFYPSSAAPAPSTDRALMLPVEAPIQAAAPSQSTVQVRVSDALAASGDVDVDVVMNLDDDVAAEATPAAPVPVAAKPEVVAAPARPAIANTVRPMSAALPSVSRRRPSSGLSNDLVPDGAILEPLQAAGLLDARSTEQALALQRERGGFLGDAILRLGVLKEVDFLRTFAELYGTRFVKSDKVVKVAFDQALLDQIPARVAESLRVLPFARHAGTDELHVIAAVPLNPQIEPEIRKLTSAKTVTVYLATPGAVQAALRRWYYGDPGILAEVTANGAGPGPMRPRSTPGAEVDDAAERERDPSQQTVQVRIDDRTATGTPVPAAPQGERALVELQKRLPLDGDPVRMLDALLDVLSLESVALLLDDGRIAVRGLRAQTQETVPRARIETAQNTRGPLLTDHAAADPLLGATRLVREKGVVSALTVPLLGRARMLGALHIDATSPIRLQLQKELSAMADLIAMRLEDAALLAKARDDQRQSVVRDRFLPPALREAEQAGQLELSPDGALIQVTLLYAQLRDFEDLTGRLSATEIVSGLNRIWTELTRVVQHHAGAITEIHGNRLLAVWSPTLGTEGDAARAIEAALALQQRAADANLSGRPLGLRVGLHTGLVTLGQMGTPDHCDFAIVGSAVKVAARLASMAAEGQVLASEPTLQRAGPRSNLKPVPLQTVHDLVPPTRVFLIGSAPGQELQLGT